jgi:hypothetical protein
MKGRLFELRVVLWGIVADLEYKIYPWKTSTPPPWAVERYGLDDNIKSPEDIDTEYEMYFDWLKCQEQKIQEIEKDIINLNNRVRTLE